jgi:hypothetical protein
MGRDEEAQGWNFRLLSVRTHPIRTAAETKLGQDYGHKIARSQAYPVCQPWLGKIHGP